MKGLAAALWTEMLKARRSRVPLITGIGFMIAPLMGGFFMIILKDPERARSMGLISAKAQLTVGTADWPAFVSVLAQATAVGGGILFAIVATWVFGREFSDRTVKELLALPTPRWAIVTAKLLVTAGWCFAITVLMLALGMLIGRLVNIPGWSAGMTRSAVSDILLTSLLTIALVPYAALVASAGRGYMAAFGWTILTIVLAQVAAVTGWGDWFPWSVPALFSGAAGPRADLLGAHSYVIIALASVVGLFLTYRWWRDADQTH